MICEPINEEIIEQVSREVWKNEVLNNKLKPSCVQSTLSYCTALDLQRDQFNYTSDLVPEPRASHRRGSGCRLISEVKTPYRPVVHKLPTKRTFRFKLHANEPAQKDKKRPKVV
jgi:hypothetical protein